MHIQCLIVDDEKPLADSTAEYLNLFNISTHALYSEKACVAFLQENTIDLLLLDVNLVDASGFSLCKKLRETYDFPILFISARTRDDDILLGLHVGGDDYIAKPYTLSVLLAKIQAILKRCAHRDCSAELLQVGSISLDVRSGKVLRKDKIIPLQGMEFKLLQYMMQHVGELLQKDRLFQDVWGSRFTQDGTLNVHIRNLRKKIEIDPQNPQYIKTIWGCGYRFEDPHP